MEAVATLVGASHNNHKSNKQEVDDDSQRGPEKASAWCHHDVKNDCWSHSMKSAVGANEMNLKLVCWPPAKLLGVVLDTAR